MKTEYLDLYEDAWRILQTAISSDFPVDDRLSVDEERELFVRLMAINYRLGRNEVSVLNLLDNHSLRSALHAVADITTVIEWCRATKEKKTVSPSIA